MNLHRIYLFFLIVPLLFSLTNCSSDVDGYVNDPHSFATPDKAKVTHLDLNIELDFTVSTILGTAILTVEKQEGVQQLRLDTKDLKIQDVQISDDGENYHSTTYLLEDPVAILGSALLIELEENTQFVSIGYSTSPEAEALQWLPDQLTGSKKMPFLLTQSQAINARTWVPIQDSPGIRFTYTAKVKAPSGMMVVMSASNPTEVSDDGIYEFEMTQPIPAYLLALAAGDFVFTPIGSRTGVYVEASTLEAAKYEFAEVEDMMQIAESLYGPYKWERYDIIVLPASFPFGGMENPRITFATPTILAGDRSLVSLVAHELAHSWSGNLVTNATWDDFWLNEGFTVYFEYRIMEALKGREYSEMLAQLSYQDLASEIISLGLEDSSTHLKLNLQNRHPDDGMNSIAYDKGYYFLRLIEETVGREKFDQFLRNYFETNAFQTMTTESFLKFLDDNLLNENEDWADSINVRAWVYGPGVPDNVPKAQAEKFQQVEAALTSSMAGEDPEKLQTETWSTHEWLHFIRHLPDSASASLLKTLDDYFKFTRSTNAEIQCAWYTKAIRNEYAPAYPAIREFLINVGRRKFLMPLYKAMMENPEGAERAKSIYKEARQNYHPISVNSIDEVVGRNE